MAGQCQTTKSVPRDVPVSSGLEIAVLSVLAAMGTLATNILLPSLPQIAISLNVTSAAVTSAITVFLAMFGIGQLLVGPLSDRYGRRWPVLIGFAVFFGGSVWCGLATDLPNLLIGRVVQAAGACATSVLSRAIARDMFSGPALARAMALIMIVMSAAPDSHRCLAAHSITVLAGAPNSLLSRPLPQLAPLLTASSSAKLTIRSALRSIW